MSAQPTTADAPAPATRPPGDGEGDGWTRRGWISSVFSAAAWTLAAPPAQGQTAAPAAAPASGAASGATSSPAGAPAAASPPPRPGFSPWLRLHADGRVTAWTNVSDIGQGTWAALAAVVAEQLELPLERVQIEQAPLEAAFHNRFIRNYATFGSLGYRTGAATLGPAAAAAREMLIAAAAERWQVAAADCRAEAGAVLHAASGRRLPYSELLAEAALRVPPERPRLKPAAEWRVLGRELPTHGARDRSTGRTVYGIDVRPPGLLFAAVVHAPGFGARLLGVDAAPARRGRGARGVEAVVPLPAAVAVVARDSWTAQQALRRLAPRWSAPHTAGLDSEALRTELRAAATAGAGRAFPAAWEPRLDEGKTMAALQSAHQVIDLSFDVPFLAHAPMEPLSATVRVDADGGGAEVWVSTQAQHDTQQAVARALGLAPERVVLHSLPAGGGFGRRAEHDWVVEAALVARAVPGRPVQTIWTRDVELRAGLYRPAAAARVRLALDAAGAPAALRADLAHPSLLEYTGLSNEGMGPKDLDGTATMGWLRQPYAVPALHLTWTRVDRGVPCGYWRSVGASQNQFFYECTLDVAARASGQDPLALRRRLLAQDRRALAFVDALATAAGWGTALPPGHARGIAIGAANGSLSGHVVELAVTAPGRFRLVRITAAIDAGVVADRRAVEAQMMGGTVFGLSAALAGEVTFEGGRVVQGNFDRYPLVTMAQLPPLQVLVLAGGERPGGVGEEGVPTIAPALANALLAASGTPVTRLPLTRAGWSLQT